MLLQQLLEINRKYVNQAVLKEKKRKLNNIDLSKQGKAQSRLDFLQKSIKITPSNLLQNASKKVLLLRNQTTREGIKQPQLNINGQKFVFHDSKIERKNSGLFQEIKSEQKFQLNQFQNSFILNTKDSGRKTSLSFFKNSDIERQLRERKTKTAQKMKVSRSYSKKNDGKKILNLPDSFTLKNFFNTFNSPPKQAIINEIFLKNKEQSIHSRKKMQTQEAKKRKKRSNSQQSMYRQIQIQRTFHEENQKNETKKANQFHIQAQKLHLGQKPKIKKQYINVFYQYRKAKVKIQKEQLYTPWKKKMLGRRDIDLTQIYHFEH